MSVLNMFKQMRAEVELQILAPYPGPLLEQCKPFGPVTLLSSMHHASGPYQRVRRKLRVSSMHRDLMMFKADLLYINSVAALPLFGSLGLPDDLPALLHVHELEGAAGFLLRNHPGLLQSRPQRYIAVSTAVQEMLIRDFGVPANRIALIPEAISESFNSLKPDVQPAARGLMIVGGAGTTDVRKGVVLWLQMAAEVLHRVGDDKVRFRWLGVTDNFEGSFYRNIAAKLGILNSVEFLPPTREPERAFQEFDLFAMTSWEDPCPLVVSEVMGLGVPVVCFEGGGGAPEQVADTGMIVSGFSPVGMADAVVNLLNDPARRRALGKAANARFCTEFTASVVAKRMLSEMRLTAGLKP